MKDELSDELKGKLREVGYKGGFGISDLLIATADIPFRLKQVEANEWVACQWSDPPICFLGETAHEATAYLLLARYKKKV